jgi:hypothetical protein
MTQVYFICAVLGGSLLVLQLLLSLIGLGGHGDLGGGHDIHVGHGDASVHHDVGGSHGISWILGLLTFRNLVGGLTFFGLIGLATQSSGWSRPASISAAVSAGVVAMVILSMVMSGITRMQDDGTIDIKRAVGQTGTVYLTIPGNKAGLGKVHMEFQNRLTEYEAVTFQRDSLSSGAKVVVVDIVAPDTLEVIAAPQYGRMTPHA